MSHFCVVVIGEDVSAALAPYQENNMGDCPEHLLKFTEDEDSEVDEKTGKPGYWENPNAKWDWWVIGGRYGGRLKVKDGAHGRLEKAPGYDTERAEFLRSLPAGFVDQARYGDVDWDGMREKRLADRTRWWAEYEAKLAASTTPAGRSFAAMEYDVEPGQTREQYIATGQDFSCFAVVKDGKWHEKGKMGWFAAVSDEKDKDVWRGELKALLSDLPPDALITVVDCHI